MKYCIAYPYLGESREQTQRPYPPSALQLLVKACKFFGMTVDEISIKSRKPELVQPRQMVMAAIHQSDRLSLNSIGELLGSRNHSTVLHAKKTVKDLCETDTHHRLIYQSLLKYLNIEPVYKSATPPQMHNEQMMTK